VNVLLVNRMMGTAWGGGENYDHHLAQALERMGHRVVILTACPPGHEIPREIGGVEATGVVIPYVRRYMYHLAGHVRFVPGFLAQLDQLIFEQVSAPLLKRLIQQYSIDVVQMLSVPHLARRLLRQGLPVVMRFPGQPAWFQSRQLRGIGAHPQAALFAHGDAVQYFRSNLGITVNEVPPGVDRTLFHPDEQGAARGRLRRDAGIREDEFVLVTVGRLIEGKGLSFLLRCMRRLRERGEEVRLVIAGGGALESRLKREAAGLSDVREAPPAGAPVPAPAQLQAADCFCLMSDYEN